MWEKIQAAIRKFISWLQQIFDLEPQVPPDVAENVLEKVEKPQVTSPVKPLALPITDKYITIDWENNPPPYRRRNVLTYREGQFHRILVRLLRKDYRILSMVRMADVMYLPKDAEDRKFHNNNILCKHFDFVICERRKFEPLLVVELDDPKHQFVQRRRIDEFKERACAEAGIPLLRVKVQHEYDKNEIYDSIRQQLAMSTQEDE